MLTLIQKFWTSIRIEMEIILAMQIPFKWDEFLFGFLYSVDVDSESKCLSSAAQNAVTKKRLSITTSPSQDDWHQIIYSLYRMDRNTFSGRMQLLLIVFNVSRSFKTTQIYYWTFTKIKTDKQCVINRLCLLIQSNLSPSYRKLTYWHIVLLTRKHLWEVINTTRGFDLERMCELVESQANRRKMLGVIGTQPGKGWKVGWLNVGWITQERVCNVEPLRMHHQHNFKLPKVFRVEVFVEIKLTCNTLWRCVLWIAFSAPCGLRTVDCTDSYYNALS